MASQTPHCGVSKDLQDRRQMADQIPPTIRCIEPILGGGRSGRLGRWARSGANGCRGSYFQVFRGRQCLGIPRWELSANRRILGVNFRNRRSSTLPFISSKSLKS